MHDIARRRRPSQTQHQIADGGRLRHEGVMAGGDFNDATSPTRELALKVDGCTPVLDAHEVRRGHVLPRR